MFLNAIRLKKCSKAVHRCFFVFAGIPHQYKTQEVCDLVFLYMYIVLINIHFKECKMKLLMILWWH